MLTYDFSYFAINDKKHQISFGQIIRNYKLYSIVYSILPF